MVNKSCTSHGQLSGENMLHRIKQDYSIQPDFVRQTGLRA